MNSYGLMSLKEQAAIPVINYYTSDAYKTGKCAPNIDGVCISGGTKVAGSEGYRLASMGYPLEQAASDGGSGGFCAAFPLWYASGRDYELEGVQLATSRFPLMARHAE